MSPEQTREKVVESWMLRAASDGGVDRFDDLHVDRIDEQWKERKTWVSAGLESLRIAAALRTRHRLPLVVAIGFSLECVERCPGTEFQTNAEFASRLDWSPPSLYLFRPAGTPCDDTGRAVADKVVEEIIIQDLSLTTLGVEFDSTRAYYLTFRSAGSSEATSSVVIES